MLGTCDRTSDPDYCIPPASLQSGCERPIGAYLNPSTGELKRASCKQWICGWCGPRRAKQIAARFAKGSYTYLVTLTMPSAEGSVIYLKKLNSCWRIFLQWLRRNYRVGHFSWVNEISQAGRIHKHVLIECSWFKFKRARAAVKRAGLGVVCDFKRVRSPAAERRTSYYLSKYLAKELNVRFPRYARRCQTTIPDERRHTDEQWLFFARYKGWKRQTWYRSYCIGDLEHAKAFDYSWGDGLRWRYTDGGAVLWIGFGHTVGASFPIDPDHPEPPPSSEVALPSLDNGGKSASLVASQSIEKTSFG